MITSPSRGIRLLCSAAAQSNETLDILNTGAKIPLLGFGTYAKDNPQDYPPSLIYEAIKQGFRHFDCAEAYQTEGAVGRGIKKALQEGIVRRDDLFITSKLWNHHHRRQDVLPTLKHSLQQLQLDYVDAYLIHWPVTDNPGPGLDPPYQETWQAMEALLSTGVTAAIGVSNMSIKKLTEVLSYAEVTPAINQIEMHPMWRNSDLLAFNRVHGIHTSAWAPLGGQIVRGASVVPSAEMPWQMQANLQALNFTLSDEDMAAVGGLKEQTRQHDCVEPMDPMFRPFFQPQGPWKSRAELWDDPVTYAHLPEGQL
ncbi:hypothetical protein WJX73_000850 [Symbiochloris irregularis]|uniref:NADP-dependent oxidoreductase domain-containing protein n=1 Tax=Symbiochloris irregularis TaxID=706552 RepID=A0AAW1NTR4_9CHLO